jgi:LysM repeat protein
MKFKILLLTALLFTISTSLFASTVIDSVGVKNNDGKKMILYKVKAKDTYYSIGRRYNIKPELLMKFNGKKKAILSLGSIVEVPTDMPFKKSKGNETAEKVVKETKKEKKARLEWEATEAKAEKKHKHKAAETQDDSPAEQPATAPERVTQQPVQQVQQQQPVQQNNTPPVQYKVSAGETLYAISKRFNTTVDEITKTNNLTSTTLVPGQMLMVRSGVQDPPPAPVLTHDTPIAKRETTMVAPSMDSSNADHRLNANRFGLYEKNEKGVATWIDDPSLDPNKKLVLHRYAPIGTVIKITNPMTNRTTFAKVVGRYTDSEATKDVIIVMTKNVADSLGALDKRFHVVISYGSPNE